jgi:hypothetical protein
MAASIHRQPDRASLRRHRLQPEGLRLKRERTPDETPFEPLTCYVSELRPHPAYVRHQLAVSAGQLSALAELAELACRDPLTVTRDRTIIDGYARYELASQKGHISLPCLVYNLNEEEALHLLLRRHRRSAGLNPFCRILLALDLEPWLRDQAGLKQSADGRNKGSSKLTQAEKLDVRSEVAIAAGVSVGNVTKVKQVIGSACVDLHEALRSGEVSIHRAWQWREMPAEERRLRLMSYRGEKGVRKTILSLLSKHVSKPLANPPSSIEMPSWFGVFLNLTLMS